jgi:putative transposase
MRAKTGISERRACQLLCLSRTVLHYVRYADEANAGLRLRITELAGQRRRFGYRRIHALWRREGSNANVKRVHRLYCQQKLQVQ